MNVIKILFLAANPSDTPRLALDEEMRAIEAKIRASAYREAFQLIPRWAVRPEELQQALLETKPDIVHFSGHGTQGRISLNDNRGKTKTVTSAALAELFKTLKDNVKVVVLNACYSRSQAEALIEHIGCAVGMQGSIGDEAAIEFAAAFYRALGFGRSVQEAFDLGRNELALQGIPDKDIPNLLRRKNVDPADIILVPMGELKGPVAVVRTDAVEKAVVVVDLSRYSDICTELEQQLDVKAVRELNEQIQGMIRAALTKIKAPTEGLPFKNTGDGAIIALDSAEQASQFAEALHRVAEEHNRTRRLPLAQRHFRVGIWTDPIILNRQTTAEGQFIGFEFAGSAIARAVRLEGACNTGEVLISPDTWGDLPKALRRMYGDQEEIQGKRSERFRAHRRKVVEPAPWDKEAAKKKAIPDAAKNQATAGYVKRYICSRLVKDWKELADELGIKQADQARFDHGRGPEGVWEWLEQRGRLGELPTALEAIGRKDLANEMR